MANNKSKRYIIGIDEVGRGPLAGPVVVAAVCVPSTFLIHHSSLGHPRDSKQISKTVREDWFAYARDHKKIAYAVAKINPAIIDRINISNAANRAAARACVKVILAKKININHCSIYLDGGLYLDTKHKSLLQGAKTIIKGDQKVPAISLASTIAKVTRDRLMVKLGKQDPRYGFELHKGYGTALHRKKLRKYGPSPLHRLTFLS